ncbi:uncharacterized protein BJX67DRAFT_377938 [Aspergillus lucknowensis]|uniref:BTB domain-containing protein n=1 Tax=Aspergillus lucknowensis TaxID=176173 RepID=A0ABR4M2G9_9EURO
MGAMDGEKRDSDPGYASQDQASEKIDDNCDAVNSASKDSGYNIVFTASNFGPLHEEVKSAFYHDETVSIEYILLTFFWNQCRPDVFVQRLGYAIVRRDAAMLRACAKWMVERAIGLCPELTGKCDLVRLMTFAMEREYDAILAVLYRHVPHDTSRYYPLLPGVRVSRRPRGLSGS